MYISAKTKICMVIGDPIKHSLSPILHNSGYKALGIDHEFVYVASQVKIDNIQKAMDGMRALGIIGMSCTMPHKLEVMKYIDELDEIAQKIGAVNTVVNRNGKLIGYNTDYLGVTIPLEQKTDLKGKKVAVLGAGGAARAIVFGLLQKGCNVTIYNRSLEKAELLANEFGCSAQNITNQSEIGTSDIIINATSVGMHPNIQETPVEKKYLSKHHIVFDAIYNPSETQLLKDAKEAGAEVVYGYEMLLYQGVAQFELFTGKKAPAHEMKNVLLENIKQ